jgi:hypothetical protein
MIVAISLFSHSEASGHSLLDDEFYFEYFLKKRTPFRFFAPPVSAKKLKARFPDAREYIKEIEHNQSSRLGFLRVIRSLKVDAGADAVFLGYTEEIVFFWYLANLFRPFRLWLIATNNISARRVSSHRMKLKCFFQTIRRRLVKIVVHTEEEVRLLDRLTEGLGKTACVKKHHLMIPIRLTVNKALGAKITISFFGPAKAEKPIEPFLELIASDATGRFCYKIYNVSKAEILPKMKLSRPPNNVSIIEDWQSRENYLTCFNMSELVFLSHTRSFEGKLSGNLCDCVALSIPFISRAVEPMVSLNEKYGTLGYTIDFEQHGWPERLLTLISRQDLSEKRCRLQQMAKDYSLQAVHASLDEALCSL